jgi:single-strand DNA-binding protein
MNRVNLIGRITNKPELRYTNSQTAYTRFTLAVKDGYGDKQRTDFIGIVAWRKLAERICNYLDKGRLIAVDGRIQTGSYEDNKGNRRYTFDVVADNVEFLDNKKDENTKKSQIELTYETEKEEEQEEDIYSLFGEEIDDEDID